MVLQLPSEMQRLQTQPRGTRSPENPPGHDCPGDGRADPGDRREVASPRGCEEGLGREARGVRARVLYLRVKVEPCRLAITKKPPAGLIVHLKGYHQWQPRTFTALTQRQRTSRSKSRCLGPRSSASFSRSWTLRQK